MGNLGGNKGKRKRFDFQLLYEYFKIKSDVGSDVKGGRNKIEFLYGKRFFR